MSRIPGLKRFVRVERDAGVERVVDDELRFHFDMAMKDLISGGMTPDEARREAERRFGDVQRTREQLASIDRARLGQERRAEWWSGFAQDMRYAARGLRLEPGFALAVIVTLGLGIGANAAMFGIVDRLLFRPPNYLSAPDRTGRVYLGSNVRGKERYDELTGYKRYTDLRKWTSSFDAMTPYYVGNRPFGTGEATKEVGIGVGGADLWKMFDVKPVIGRLFGAEDDVPPDGQKVVVLSYAFWKTQFGGRYDVLGAQMDLGPDKFTVIGVAPKGFHGLENSPAVAFIPMGAAGWTMGGPQSWYESYYMNWFSLFARRKPNVSQRAADADLSAAYQRSWAAQSDASPGMSRADVARPHAVLGPVLRDRGRDESNSAKVATWLLGVAGIVLLIACANVANLLLARALERRREISLRVALGVSRARLLMQLFTESMMLAVLGGVAGLAVAQWGGRIMRKALFDEGVNLPDVWTDGRVVLVGAGLTLVTGLLTGLAPAMYAARADVAAAMKSGAREGATHRSRLRAALIIGQAALSVVLLVGAGLFIHSLVNAQHVRLGYDADRLLWVETNNRGVKLDSVQEANLQRQLLAKARATPGVANVSRGLSVPFWNAYGVHFYVAGIDTVSRLGDFDLQAGTPELFATMGTHIVRGRGFSADDRQGAPRVLVVSQAMAKKLWPTEDPIGKCVRFVADTMPCSTVVGVAEDVRHSSLGDPALHYYLPIDQFQPNGGGLFVRTVGPSEEQVEQLRGSLQPLMPGASYVTVTSLETILGNETESWRLGATMFAVFGGLALAIAAIGLYSLIAYTVMRRTHEMGVRVALGAQTYDVIRLIVHEGLGLALPGVALGAGIALLAGPRIAPLLFEVSPKDPPVFVSVAVVLVAVAVVASWIPALRAARVDPNVALRAD